MIDTNDVIICMMLIVFSTLTYNLTLIADKQNKKMSKAESYFGEEFMQAV